MKYLKSVKAKAVAGVALIGGSAGFAQAADYTTQISSAATDGTTNVTAVIAAVIGIAILGFSVGRMLGWFSK
ncbi:MAG: hypothetical protein HRT53_20970 [Colwellia sp.]|nr:hypothetical protein [Colwellia sp.]